MPFWKALQDEVYDLLTDDAAYKSSGSTEYYVSYVPPSAQYPYVVTPGDSVSKPWYTMGNSKGEELLWNFHVWCNQQNGGATKVRTVGKAVMNAMDDASLNATGYTTLMFRRVLSTQPMRQDGDPELFQQVIRYRVMLAKT